MKSVEPTVFSSNTEFYEQSFSSLIYPSTIIENTIFEGCRFINANFSGSQFIHCKFVDCEFKNCNLSAAQLKASLINNASFFESKVIGVNWTMLIWPLIRLSSPFHGIEAAFDDFLQLTRHGLKKHRINEPWKCIYINEFTQSNVLKG